MADFNIDELQALQMCKDEGLLSPKYQNSFRAGCWFCVKQSMWDLYCLYRDYPQLFQMLVDMQKDSFNPFRPTKDLYKIKQEFDSGKIPKIAVLKLHN